MRRADQTSAFLLALGTFLIYIAFTPPGIYSVDGNSMLAVSDSLVTRHNVTVPEGLGIVGRNGATYSSWYPLQSFLAVPFVAIGIVSARALHLPVHYVEAMFALILPSILTGITVLLVYALGLRLGGDSRGAWLVAVIYGFGTIAFVYTREFLAEPLLGALATAAVYLTFEGNILGAAALAGAAVLAKPSGILIGPILSFYLLAKSRSWKNWMPVVGTAAGLGCYFLYNFYRFGNPLTFGQSWSRFSVRTIPAGVAGLLISPGEGVAWFCPCVLLVFVALRKSKKRLEVLTVLGLFMAFIGLHSYWGNWAGGWSWGPRLLLPALPALISTMAILQGLQRKILIALAAIGFLISAPNLAAFYTRYYAEAFAEGISDSDLMWRLGDSPLVHAWPAAIRQIADARNEDVRELFGERGKPAKTISTSRALRVVAIWWWVLPIVHIPKSAGILLSLALIIAGLSLMLRSRRISICGVSNIEGQEVLSGSS